MKESKTNSGNENMQTISSYLFVFVYPPLPLSYHDSHGTGKDLANLVVFHTAVGWHAEKSLAQVSTVINKLHNWSTQKFSQVHIQWLTCT
jgi:hypothetical protein